MDVLPKPTVEHLRNVVNNFPLIDNHAHNIIQPAFLDTVPFEAITSEAQGRALRDAFKSLSHLRAARQLRQLYECSDDANWEELLEQRTEWLRSNPERLNQQCFQGVHALLIDDGLASPDKVFPYHWHDRYTKAPTKRIVRIETLAERLMEIVLDGATDEDLDEASFLTDTWVEFTGEFEREIQEAIQDPEVAGFKTVICYRTGLDIEPDYEQAAREVGLPFERYLERCIRKKKYRIERKSLNDYLVLRTLEILSERLLYHDAKSKPFQLHTGLGDNDISLVKSNPAALQPLIENYTSVPFVLLHSAYPYTREAGYLATVYRNVYLDIGEVFPMVSRDGQRAVLRQALEIVPGSKLLYSSDGHYLPETFWLANLQFREVWLDLLLEYVEKEDITPHQAIAMTKDFLFNNSNVLYNLRYEVVFDDLAIMPKAPKALMFNTRSGSGQAQSPTIQPFPTGPDTRSPPSALAPFSDTRSPPPTSAPPSAIPRTPSEGHHLPPFPLPPKEPQVYDIQVYETFTNENPQVKFVYVQWLDYMATVRARIVPIKEFDRMIRSGSRIGISQGNTGTLQNDGATPVVNPVGQIYVEPDLRSLRRSHSKDPLPSATVMSFWRSETGGPIRECPRANLELFVHDLQYNHGIKLLFGFEIEITFLRRNDAQKEEPYTPLTQTHAWGTMSPEQWLQVPFLAEIATSLSDIGIDIQQFHSESGQGQYEFVLAPQEPLLAIDSLIQARQVVAQIAALHGLRATLHPKPFPGIGTAAHVHISLDPPDKDLQFFVGGVLNHLPAICAFTMPEEVSYGRVVDDSWTGGTWVAWGTQNREVPLRRVSSSRWEIRCLDGFANMYFALGAVLAAGLLGLKSNVVDFPQKDVPQNPSQLDEEGRAAYGILQKMPVSFEEATRALGADTDLREALADGFVGDYLVMKESEQKMLAEMADGERRVWLIERY